MKILKPTDRKGSFEDLEREIRVISGLHHPHIIGLHDVLYHLISGYFFIFIYKI